MEFSFGRIPEEDISCRALMASMETALRILANNFDVENAAGFVILVLVLLVVVVVVVVDDCCRADEDVPVPVAVAVASWNVGDKETTALRYWIACSVDIDDSLEFELELELE